MTPRNLRFVAGTLAASLVLAIGCKASAIDTTDFLGDDAERMTEQDDYPFHNVWFAPEWNSPDRKTIYIAPVDTAQVQNTDWWKEAEEEAEDDDEIEEFNEVKEDLLELGEFTREEFQNAFREDDEKRFTVVDAPQDDSLIFELALVFVVPNNASLGALGLAATVVMAPFGLAIAAKETAKGGAAIEGRLKNAESGEIVGMFSDREQGKFAPINTIRATRFGEIHKVIREWSEQWVKIANLPAGENVRDTKPFTLQIW